MKLVHILLAVALIVPMGCGKLSLDDPKVGELEKRVAKIEAQLAEVTKQKEQLRIQRDALIQEKVALAEENEQLKKDLAEVIGIADYYRNIVKEVVPERVISIYKIEYKNNQLINNRAAEGVAKEVLEIARKHDFKIKLKVEGYSSHNGSAKHNMWVSKERAEAVLFKIMGVAGDDAKKFSHTHVIAHGEESDNKRKVVVTLEVF